MTLGRLIQIMVLSAIITTPGVAQTLQATPTSPSSSTLPTTPGAATGAPAARGTAAPSARASSTLVDINSASQADLDALPGIGSARASAIIKNRPYKGKDDLLSRHILPPNIYKGVANKIIARQG